MADHTTKFFHDTFMKLLEEQLEEVKTQEEADEIVKKFEELDLGKIIADMYAEMANDTTNYMRNTMYEQVMQFRAEEQEFFGNSRTKMV